MTSPSRDPSKAPIRKIALRLSFEGPSDELQALSKRIGGERSAGRLVTSFETSDVTKAIERVRSISEVLRDAQKNPKGFK